MLWNKTSELEDINSFNNLSKSLSTFSESFRWALVQTSGSLYADVNFSPKLQCLNDLKIEAEINSKIDEKIIENYVNSYEPSNNLMLEHQTLMKYKEDLDLKISHSEEDLIDKLRQLLKFKHQRIILEKIDKNIDEQKLINSLKDRECFKQILTYIDFEHINIKYTSYMIPHFYPLMKESKDFNFFNFYCAKLYQMCMILNLNGENDLIEQIFTQKMINLLIRRFKREVKRKKSSAKRCHDLYVSTSLGEILQRCLPLNALYKEFYNSLLLIDKLKTK